jgi:hypothetical protein
MPRWEGIIYHSLICLVMMWCHDTETGISITSRKLSTLCAYCHISSPLHPLDPEAHNKVFLFPEKINMFSS